MSRVGDNLIANISVICTFIVVQIGLYHDEFQTLHFFFCQHRDEAKRDCQNRIMKMSSG